MRNVRLSTFTFAAMALLCAASVASSSPASAAKSARVAEVKIGHVHVVMSDLLPNAAPEAANIDLGQAPQVGGTRMIDHDELATAFTSRELEVPSSLPTMVRVTRQVESLDARAVDRMVREALDSKLTKGVTLIGARLTRPLEVPAGYTRVTAELPHPPRKAGPLTSATSLTFYEDDQVIAMVSVVVDLLLSDEATIPDVPRGTHITLVMRRGLVEVSTQGQANIDGDIGGVVPVLLRPSGRVIRARIEDKDHAIALED